MPDWVSHISPDGRPYWFNPADNVSVWEKPDELKTSQEKELGLLNWKEYQTAGRKYWVNSITKETTWECPKEVLAILNKPNPSKIPTGPSADRIPTGPKAYSPEPIPKLAHPSLPLTPISGALVSGGGYGQIRPNYPPVQQQQSILPEFMTLKDAETAFMNMLSEIGVDEKWNWEQVMRETITLPMYKVYKTSAERKATFEKYVQQLLDDEKETMALSVERGKKAWNSAMDKLNGGPDKEGGVKIWWNWEMRKEELKTRIPDAWDNLRNDDERRILFDDYLAALKRKQATRAEELRTKNISKLTRVLQTLSLDLAGSVGWKDAQEVIASTKEWQTDTELQLIDPIDVLAIFEEEVRKADREMTDTKQRIVFEKRRSERKARAAYIVLLDSLIASGAVTYRSTWKSTYPLLESTEAYQNLLGTTGSSPLDLFWDATDQLELRAESDLILVEKVVDEKIADFKEAMTYEEFVKVLEGDTRLAEVDYSSIKVIFDRCHDRAVRHNRDDRRRAEKKLRVQIDDLRYAFKKLDPPFDLESSFEDIISRVEATPEYIALDDLSRRTAFEKFVKRQKEKLKERDEVSDTDSIRSGGKRKDSSARTRSEREVKRKRLSEETTIVPEVTEMETELEEGEI